MTEINEKDEKEIVRLYVNERWTLRQIANKFNTNHHRIKRILLRNDVEITTKGRRRVFTEEHRRKIGEARKGSKPWSHGKKMTREHNIKNMVAHIKYDVDFDFYNQFDDIEKVKCLNRILTRDRVSVHFDTERYKQFILKFYYDEQFNIVFNRWKESGFDKWYRPSLDHIVPLSRGGSWELSNLQILSWFENRAKCDMTQEEWDKFKIKTGTRSALFI